MYLNKCRNVSPIAEIFVQSLVYLSYAVTLIVLAVYVRIYIFVKYNNGLLVDT